ncbi:hypothetical protein BDF20DRAFT_830024, partial [Mycotypha africana]|uniref:uncharacterized protein n=1 Tax=Mycotypha africana TaxID=64632 RepID=UPI0022FFEA1C
MSILTTGEPRKKRAKIVSACAECRRKKTKCNGEQPCRNCEKSGVQCIYPALMNQHHHLGDRRNNNNTLMNSDGSTAVNKAALESIEQRLQSIEDMLRHLIQYQH